MRKRKTLPKDFDELLRRATLDELKEVFAKCELDARGGYAKQTAIGFLDCPDELVIWLVERGLDVDAPDSYGATPLWERADMGHAEQLPLLVSLGADIERPRANSGTPLHGAAGSQQPSTVRSLIDLGAAIDAPLDDDPEKTPLIHALRRTTNVDIPGMHEVAKLLLEAGARVPEEAVNLVREIGERFEFFRADFDQEFLPEVATALSGLYELFGVAPVGARRLHDGTSAISVPEGPLQLQHADLWDYLVPASGPATTVQGELIRATGKVAREILDNGAANWGRDYRALVDAVPGYLSLGNALPPQRLDLARQACQTVRTGTTDEATLAQLATLAIDWIRQNPTPLPLAPPSYQH